MTTDLYSREREDLESQMETVESLEPGMWKGFNPSNIGQSAAHLAVRSMAGLRVLHGALPVAQDYLRGLASGAPDTELQDRFFASVDEGYGKLVRELTPDPQEVGMAAQMAGSLLFMLPAIIAAPTLGITAMAAGETKELMDEGVPWQKALAVGGVTAAGLGVGFRVPILGRNLAQRVLIGGAGFNVFQGIVMRGGSAAVLGDDPQAARYPMFDPAYMFMDIAMGAGFGLGIQLHPGLRAQGAEGLERLLAWTRGIKPSHLDAIAVLRHSQHLNIDSLPGKPATAKDIEFHVERIKRGLEQAARNEPINVVDMPEPRFEVDAAREAENAAHVKELTASAEEVRIDEGIAKPPEPEPAPPARLAPEDLTLVPHDEQPRAIGQAVENRLLELKVEPDQARANAAVWEAFFKTTSEKYGVRAADLLATYGIDVRRMASDQSLPDALTQGGKHSVTDTSRVQEAKFDAEEAAWTAKVDAFNARQDAKRGKVAAIDQAAARARLKEIKTLLKPLAEKGGLTREEGVRFEALSTEADRLRYGIEKPAASKEVVGSGERLSTLSAETNTVAHADLLSNREVYLAIRQASAGAGFNRTTAVDKVMLGENPNLSARDLYDVFAQTRAKLREQYGPTIHLYRATGKQIQKPTTNWATTKEFAQQFGDNVIERDVPVDQVVAANVTRNGKYHELIVADKIPPATLFQSRAVQARWYSELARQLEAANMKAAPAKAWKDYLKGLAGKGVKADEIKWSGIEEWLDLQDGRVTKEQVAEFLKNNGVKVEETVYGEKVTTLAAENRDLHNELRDYNYEAVFGRDPNTDENLITGVTDRSTGEFYPFEPGVGFVQTEGGPELIPRVLQIGKRFSELEEVMVPGGIEPEDVERAQRFTAEAIERVDVAWRNVEMVLPLLSPENRANVPWWAHESVGADTAEQRQHAAKQLRELNLSQEVEDRLKEYARARVDAQRAAEQQREVETAFEEGSESPQPKFAGYQLPGGRNYRELVLTLPRYDKGGLPAGYNVQRMANGEYTLVGPDGAGRVLRGAGAADLDPADLASIARDQLRGAGVIERGQDFISSHFPDINPLAHVRFNERTDAAGKKVLFVEEIQSDWAQKGKREGFKGQSDPRELRRLGVEWDKIGNDAQTALEKGKLPDGYTTITDSTAAPGQRWAVIPAGQAHGKPMFRSWPSAELAIEEAIRKIAQQKQDVITDQMNAIHDRVRAAIPAAPFVSARKFAVLTGKSEIVKGESVAAELKNAKGQVVRFKTTEEAQAAAEKLGTLASVKDLGMVEDTPAWVGLTLKRMIRWAAENGFERVAWTTGEQQVTRYTSALRKAVDAIEWKKTPEGVQLVGYKGKKGDDAMRAQLEAEIAGLDADLQRNMERFPRQADTPETVRRHMERQQRQRGIAVSTLERLDNRQKVVDTTEKEDVLSDAIGKSMADKIRNDPAQSGTIEGENIKVDDTGMATFYDRIVPNVAKDILKKLGGGKLVESTIEAPRDLKEVNTEVLDANGNVVNTYGGMLNEQSNARIEAESIGGTTRLIGGEGTTKQQGFDITPELRERALSGMPLFQGARRGQIQLGGKGAENIIGLFETANASTFMHESGHLFLQITRDMASSGRAPLDALSDWSALARWLKIEGGEITREQQEKFATSFERYLAEGKAPTPELRSVFQQFRDWLLQIYRSLADIADDLPDEITGVMDRMLASERADPTTKAKGPLPAEAEPPPPPGEAGAAGRPEAQVDWRQDVAGRQPAAAEVPKLGLDDAGIRESLQRMAQFEAGWSERGGQMIRHGADGRAGDETVTRTKWIPKSEFWPGRPDKSMTEAGAKEAVRKATAGEPLRAAEKRLIDYMLELANERAAAVERVGEPEEWNATARDLADTQTEPSTQNVVDTDAVARAAEIDELAVETAAKTHENDDTAFMVEIRRILGDQDARQQGPGERAPEGGQEGAGEAPRPGEPGAEPDPLREAAIRYVEENPDRLIPFGEDADGNTTYRSLREYLDEELLAAQEAREDTSLLHAAAQCLYGRA